MLPTHQDAATPAENKGNQEPATLAVALSHLIESLRQQPNRTAEIRLRPDGRQPEVLLQLVALLGFRANSTDGEPHYLLQIQELNFLEQWQKQELHWLRTAIATSTDGILITDNTLDPPGPHIVFVNPAFCRMTGYTEAELLGRNPRLLQGPLTDPEVMRRIRHNLERNQPVTATTYNYRKNGQPFMLEWTMSPIFAAEDAEPIYWVASQRDISERVIAQQKQLEAERKLTRDVALAQEKERRRIAQDLHDSLGQHLSLVKLYFGQLQRHIGTEGTAEATPQQQEMLHTLGNAIETSIDQMRRIARNLAPRVLMRAGLFAGLEQLGHQIEHSSEIKVHFTTRGEDQTLDLGIRMAVYRIMQELLSNTVKHAEANNIRYSASVNKKELLVEYRDNGKGLAENRMPAGMGIDNIRTRVAALGGDFELFNHSQGGIQALISIPLEPVSDLPPALQAVNRTNS